MRSIIIGFVGSVRKIEGLSLLLEAARREAWFMDQYKHPHETKHSIGELLRWFDAAGFEFTSSVPTIGDVEFSEDTRLFEPQSAKGVLTNQSVLVDLLDRRRQAVSGVSKRGGQHSQSARA